MKMTILIVEDNRSMRRIVSDLVRRIGFFSRIEAIDGSDAIKKMTENHVDFIISDWNMEPMNGLELLKHVRKDPKYGRIPFLMVTAESKVKNVLEAKKAGVSNYIVKPFSLQILKDKMSSILGPL